MVEVHIKADKFVTKKKVHRSRCYAQDWLTLTLLCQLIFISIAAGIISFLILFG